MQIAKREQRKISLISVIAKKAGGEANTALIKGEGKEVSRKLHPNQRRTEGFALCRSQDLGEVPGPGGHGGAGRSNTTRCLRNEIKPLHP